MAYGDIAPGAHKVQPGADPQLKVLHVLARDAMGYRISTRDLAMACDLTSDQCRRACKSLAAAELLASHIDWGRTGFSRSRILWSITDKGRAVVGAV